MTMQMAERQVGAVTILDLSGGLTIDHGAELLKDTINSLIIEGRTMRVVVTLVALFVMVVGALGLVFPDSVTTIRHLYFATSVGLYGAAAVRVAMGLIVILSAARSRAPTALRVLGAVMCAQGLSAAILGPERAQTILAWEATHTTLLRAGALVALVTGGFIACAVTNPRQQTSRPAAR